MLKEFLILLLSAFYFDKYGLVSVEALIGSQVKEVRDNKLTFSVAFINLEISGDRTRQYFCGGTLITKKHVLTGAHCLERKIISSIKVLIGSNDLLSPAMKSYDIGGYLSFENWAKSKGIINSVMDVAIVKLLTATFDIVPISISPVKGSLLEGMQVGMAAWGQSNGVVSRIMKQARLRIVPVRRCLQRPRNYPFWLLDQIAQHQVVCSAADPQIIGSPGNCGSPVFDIKKKTLIGIHHGIFASWGDVKKSSNIVTTIDSCRSFIRDVVGAYYCRTSIQGHGFTVPNT